MARLIRLATWGSVIAVWSVVWFNVGAMLVGGPSLVAMVTHWTGHLTV